MNIKIPFLLVLILKHSNSIHMRTIFSLTENQYVILLMKVARVYFLQNEHTENELDFTEAQLITSSPLNYFELKEWHSVTSIIFIMSSI